MTTPQVVFPTLRFGRFLQRQGYLSRDQLNDVLKYQKEQEPTLRIGEIAVLLGFLKKPQLLRAFAQFKAKLELQECLASPKFIDQETFHRQVKDLAAEGGKLQRSLGGVGYFNEEDVVQILRATVAVQNIKVYFISRQSWANLEYQIFPDKNLLPIGVPFAPITMLRTDKAYIIAVDDLDEFFGNHIELPAATRSEVADLAASIYIPKNLGMAVTHAGRSLEYVVLAGNDLSKEVEDLDVINIANYLIQEGVRLEASDLHIEPLEYKLRIRYRIDGILHHYTDLPVDLVGRLISRIKILCELEISEKRRHQDGKIRGRIFGEQIDLRVSAYVGEFGETIVIRYLPKVAENDITEIGLAPRMFAHYKQIIESPSGIVLVTGPTGSGKTTTLYASAKHLNDYSRKIISVEDPIEYTIDGVTQGEVNPKVGVDYLTSLKAILRQDPDVVILGEIRDRIAAEATVQAGLTGHKIFTTFHTDDTTGALLRLMDMGIDTFLISSTVVSVLAQRLVRRVCNKCSEPYLPEPALIEAFKIRDFEPEHFTFRRGKGCSLCKYTGYRGRTGIFELLVLNDHIRNAILLKKTSSEIRQIARKTANLLSMREDGLYKTLLGQTTLEEVHRVVFHSESDEFTGRTVEEIFELLAKAKPPYKQREEALV